MWPTNLQVFTVGPFSGTSSSPICSLLHHIVNSSCGQLESLLLGPDILCTPRGFDGLRGPGAYVTTMIYSLFLYLFFVLYLYRFCIFVLYCFFKRDHAVCM